MKKEKCKESLRILLEDTNEVYAIVMNVSRQGTSRHFKFLAVNNNKMFDITYMLWDLKLVGSRRGKGKNEWYLYVPGCGMDMAFHVVDALSQELNMFLLKRTI